jgi:hypothetical protein
MLPVGVKVLLAGSYNSALASVLLPKPPAMSTFPFGRRVAVGATRPTPMLPVAVNNPAEGPFTHTVASAVTLPIALVAVSV